MTKQGNKNTGWFFNWPPPKNHKFKKKLEYPDWPPPKSSKCQPVSNWFWTGPPLKSLSAGLAPPKIPKYGNNTMFHIVLPNFWHVDEENWLCVERMWCFIAFLQPNHKFRPGSQNSSNPPSLKGPTQLRQAGPSPFLHVANSPPDLALVVVVEVIKEILGSSLKVLQGWWKSLVNVSLQSNTKVWAKRHCWLPSCVHAANSRTE